jgi:hypothetical protein
MEIGDPKSDLGNPAVENLAKFSRGLKPMLKTRQLSQR